MSAKRKHEDGDPRRRLQVAVCASNTSVNKRYNVTIRDGQWECACRAWCTTTPRRDCKHIFYVKGALQKVALQDFACRDGRINTSGGSWAAHHGIHFGEKWQRFVEKHLGVTRTDKGEAMLLLIPMVDEQGLSVSGAWNTLVEIINHDAEETT